MPASAWVQRFAPLARSGRVLDVACGTGRHALLFAQMGCRVDAVDIDPAYAATLAHPAIKFTCADLEAGSWPYGGQQFDVIVVCNYLHRPLLPTLASALAPSGLLLYETFAVGNEQFGRPSNPAYLLRPRELLDAFAPRLHVLAYEDGIVAVPKPARVQRLAALRGVPGAAPLDPPA